MQVSTLHATDFIIHGFQRVRDLKSSPAVMAVCQVALPPLFQQAPLSWERSPQLMPFSDLET